MARRLDAASEDGERGGQVPGVHTGPEIPAWCYSHLTFNRSCSDADTGIGNSSDRYRNDSSISVYASLCADPIPSHDSFTTKATSTSRTLRWNAAFVSGRMWKVGILLSPTYARPSYHGCSHLTTRIQLSFIMILYYYYNYK